MMCLCSSNSLTFCIEQHNICIKYYTKSHQDVFLCCSEREMKSIKEIVRVYHFHIFKDMVTSQRFAV